MAALQLWSSPAVDGVQKLVAARTGLERAGGPGGAGGVHVAASGAIAAVRWKVLRTEAEEALVGTGQLDPRMDLLKNLSRGPTFKGCSNTAAACDLLQWR